MFLRHLLILATPFQLMKPVVHSRSILFLTLSTYLENKREWGDTIFMNIMNKFDVEGKCCHLTKRKKILPPVLFEGFIHSKFRYLPVVNVNNCKHEPFSWLKFILDTMLVAFSFDFHWCENQTITNKMGGISDTFWSLEAEDRKIYHQLSHI